MSLQTIPPSEFFAWIVYMGILATVCIYVPVKLVAKWRRVRRARTHLVCRICGFRFLRRDADGTCPHCQSRN